MSEQSQTPLNTSSNELTVTLGGVERTLRFRNKELVFLGRRLNADPVGFLRDGGDAVVFLSEAIFCGLSGGRDARSVSPEVVCTWLDRFKGNTEELMLRILYAIANARPGSMKAGTMLVVDGLARSWGFEVFPQAPEGADPAAAPQENPEP